MSGGPAVALYSGDWRVDAVARDGVPQFRVRHLGYAVQSHSILRTVDDVRRVMPAEVFAALQPVSVTP